MTDMGTQQGSQQKIAEVILTEEETLNFHAEECTLPKRSYQSFGEIFVMQDLIVLPVTKQFGNYFAEYECPSCHEWIARKYIPGDH